MINRIKEIAQFYGLSSTAFADQVEIPRPVISHIFSERNRPSLEVVQKIGLAFPEVDLAWLLYGKGEMIKKAIPVIEVPETDPVTSGEKVSNTINVKDEVVSAPDTISDFTAKPEAPAFARRRNAVKIVFLYDDNSFEEFWP